MTEWVEHGGGAAFSIPITELRSKTSSTKKASPHNFLKKGARASSFAAKDNATNPNAETPKPRNQSTPSIKSRIQNYRKEAIPRDKFQDAVVVLPKRPNIDVVQYQKQTEEAAMAFQRAREKDDDARQPAGVQYDDHSTADDVSQDSVEEDVVREHSPVQAWERPAVRLTAQRRQGAVPMSRAYGNEFEDNFDDTRKFESQDVRKPMSGKINQNYSRKPSNNGHRWGHDQERDYDRQDAENEEEFEDYPPRRDLGVGRSAPRGGGRSNDGGADGFKQFLVDKMKELEEEIAIYKKENLRLQSITQEQEIVLQKLMEEKEDARQQLEEDQAEFEQYKEEEMKRLRARVSRMEQRAKEAAKVVPKKEREEIDVLSSQLEQLRDEMAAKDGKARAECERLRKEISELQLKNVQLQAAAREQQLKEINKQFDARLADNRHRKLGNDRLMYQKQYEHMQDLHSQTIDHDEDDVIEEEEGYFEEEEQTAKCSGSWRASGSQSQKLSSSALPPSNKRQPLVHNDDDVESGDDSVQETPDDELIDSHTYPDNKLQRIYSSGKREIVYTNGTVKKLLPTGHVVLHFSNGDIKKTFPSTKIIYYYALAQTTHITYPNGMQVFEFINQQVEKHFPDGMKEIAFPDGTIKYIHPDGSEDSIFPTAAVPHAVAKKMVRSSKETTVVKAFNLHHDSSEDRTATVF
uniref:Centromere protein J C-terminal domain-containing protein n=1 Tax=Eutreptiella gymnastica TaxID=73025 RepID=A0A7S4CXA1_9EUGL